jgi:hypothetical protein
MTNCHTFGIELEIVMKNDIALAVVDSLFCFCSGRFNNQMFTDELSSLFDEHWLLEGLIIDIHLGRDMTIIGFADYLLHGPVLIRRYPVDKIRVLGNAFNRALKEIISAAVLTVRTLPTHMLTRTIFKNKQEEGDWVTCDGDLLGEAIANGLLSRHCTFTFGAGEFSVFYEDASILGQQFKPPRYFNNIFHLPSRKNDDRKYV